VSPPDPRITSILTKLERARRENRASFGSDAHRFALNPTLHEGAVVAFEAEHGVRLPEGYRSFVLHAGDGGAGPYYGLYPVAQWDDFAKWVSDEPPRGWRARPSPLAPSLAYGGRRWGSVAPLGDCAPTDWIANAGATSDTVHEAYVGTLALGSQGCSLATLLVVSGAHAGRVVYVDAEHQAPYFVPDADFLDWYERWLDELLAGYEMGPFGFGMVGSALSVADAFADSSLSDAVREEAGRTLLRTGVASEMEETLLRTLRDSSASIRVWSIAAIARFRIARGFAPLRAMVRDADGAARARAIRALAELAIDGWTEDVRPCLHDPAYDVASAAIFALQKVDALTRDDLRPLLSAESGATRGLALWAGKWTRADAPAIAPLLDDDALEARRYAILALRAAGAREYAASFVRRLAVETDLGLIEALAYGLGELGDARTSLPALGALLTHDDDFVRVAAIEGLGHLGDPRGAPLLARFLKDTRRPERRLSRGHTKTFAQLALPAYERCRRSRRWWMLK
jgi:HEAT repeat protein